MKSEIRSKIALFFKIKKYKLVIFKDKINKNIKGIRKIDLKEEAE